MEITPNDIKKEIKNLAQKKTPKYLSKGEDMSVIMRYIGQRNCTKKNFPKEPHLFFFCFLNFFLVKNYRPVSVLPTVSKPFEKTMQKQIIDYINQFLLP